MIADVAAVFHWPLSDMITMEIDELCRWQDLAVDRWNRMNRTDAK
ncbi:MAG TPA: GpE family phage tail protein [Croceicoccus sp.]|nr:GpE family phage tail protein [Croceicoccus sp.]